MKRTIIAVVIFCMFYLVGCGSMQSETNDSSNTLLDFSKIEDIPYNKEHFQHEKEKAWAIQISEQLEILKNKYESENVEEEVPQEYYEEEYVDNNYYYYDENYVDYSYNDNYSGTYYAEYNELYNTDGPSHTMPGWHDGYLETYYNASSHYLAGTWTVDDEGFYHDENGRYVVGVDINDINPETGEQYQYGDVVDTGKGEGVVYDYGQGAHVHDFATNW